MNAMSFVATTLVAGAFMLPAQVVKTTASAAPEPTLTVSESLRALVMRGEPGRPYAMFVGELLAPTRLAPGVELEIEPIGVFHAGVLDRFGDAYAPIDLQGRIVGDCLFFQSILWPGDPGDYVPDQMTEVCEVAFGPYQTIPPDDPPPERIYVVHKVPYVAAKAEFVTYGSRPNQVGAHVTAVVPTSGYSLRADEVLHAGQFTRVLATMERPSAAEIVGEGPFELELVVPLGIWAGQVEIQIRDLPRPPPLAEQKQPVGILIK